MALGRKRWFKNGGLKILSIRRLSSSEEGHEKVSGCSFSNRPWAVLLILSGHGCRRRRSQDLYRQSDRHRVERNRASIRADNRPQAQRDLRPTRSIRKADQCRRVILMLSSLDGPASMD